MIVDAVDADITPPATDPSPGKSLRIFVARVRPEKAAPPTPIADAIKVLSVPYDILKPKTEEIPAIIPTWIGARIAASENGIGLAPAAAAATAAPATIL